MIKYFSLLLLSITGYCGYVNTPENVSKTIQFFGAKGDGKTNDTEAFIKASKFFNDRGGNGTLIIPKGIYIVGKQTASDGDVNKYAYTGIDILNFKDLKNLVIKGEDGTIIKYDNNLKLGSFDPLTGKVFNDNDPAKPAIKYAGAIGSFIAITNCKNVTVTSLVLDGNNKSIQFGGRYSDLGIQLGHVGIYITDSHSILIENINSSYFGLDGIIVTNKPSSTPDDIRLLNVICEYNSRQGLSWVGGNSLVANNCQFNHTGRIGYYSAPGAGVDIESEVGPISNGYFTDCQFINNSGCGMVSDNGYAISNCNFSNCTFWGTTNWSVWVSSPSFTFSGCKIYGSIVHGFNAENDKDATRYINCFFEDKPYNNQPPYGKFMIECDGPRKMLFDSCTFTTNTTAVGWLNTNTATSDSQKATIRNSRFIINKTVDGNAVFSFHHINFKNNTVEFKDPAAKEKDFWKNPCCISKADRDATKIIYNN